MSRPAGESAKIATLYSAEQIAERVAVLAGEIAAVMGEDLLVIPILKGSFIFAADMLRALHKSGVAPDMDFISLSSYGTGTVSGGQVTIVRDTQADIEGRPVLLIDDVLESGRTLAFAKDLMAARRAASVRTCVLLDKQVERAVDVTPDFVGFECPDKFVVGYGMDIAHAYRQLPFVGYIEP
ncbi:MAG: hypoxanthine phosphoribosyltransferase [Parvibaculaceae bacterium]|nr:hypoxanthine phosphoribosyltransferase [Parvibaculaceae bacterium]